MSFDAATQAALAGFDLAAYAQRDGIALHRVGKVWQGCCPFHSEHTPSFTVWPTGRGWYCFGCGRGGSALDYVIDRADRDRHDKDAIRDGLATLGIGQGHRLTLPKLTPRAVPPKAPAAPLGTPVAVYNYHDPAGVLRYQVLRYQLADGKTFRQRRPDGRGGWVWNLDGIDPLLYNLPAILAADPARPVFVTEGEKDADRLIAGGLLATCNNGGAGHWPASGAPILAGRPVIILPDADEAGGYHAEIVASELRASAAAVKIIALPGLPAHGDVSDFLDAGHTLDALEVLASFAPALAALDPASGEIAGDSSSADVVALCAELQRTRDERDVLHAWKAKTLDILFGESTLEISDRVSLITLNYLIEIQGLPIGQEVPFSGKDTAARLHLSESTISRYTGNWQAMGLAEHRVTPGEPICDKHGRPLFTPTGAPKRRKQAYLSCTAAPYEVEIAVLHSPPGQTGAQHGGARRPCPYCGAAGEKQETITRRRCLECHREYEHDQHVADPAPQFHDETTEIPTGFMMKLEAPPVLRSIADDLRRAAPDNPRVAATLAGTRARLHRADQDADTGAYAHGQARAASTSRSVCPDCPPLEACSCWRGAANLPAPPPRMAPVGAGAP